MIEYYAQIRWVHVAAVLCSGGLFAIRGVLMLRRSDLGMSVPVRFLSYVIDTILLTAALMLVTLLHQYPFVHGWLTAKVLLLAVYIVLGSLALKRGRTPKVRAACFGAALLVYAYIISVALAHHASGVFAGANTADRTGAALLRRTGTSG